MQLIVIKKMYVKSKYNKENLENPHMSLHNSSHWSPCSVKAIEEYVSKATCLFNEPEVNAYPLFDWQDLADKLQGGAPDLLTQCSSYKWPAVDCGDSPCQYLECTYIDQNRVSDITNQPICLPQGRNYAMEGTDCGGGKFCFQGDCVKGKNQS